MRLEEHPIISIPERKEISFTFDGEDMLAFEGEMISSALFANGVKIFNWHHADGFPQGIFCANGQCAQCLVLANGVPVKACITKICDGMDIEPIKGLPDLPEDDECIPVSISEVSIDVLVVGAGPAGLSAAIELGKMGVRVIVADDKHELGGKLSLQTHNFFGSMEECYAGTRGMDIGHILSKDVASADTVDIWLNSPVVGVYSDKKVGIVKDGRYVIVSPEHLLIATGAREKSIAFPGCDLPGVYGAGAFQTLVNRDLVRSSKRIFVLGGGNVGLIASYHALQAGIEVAGLAEGLPECGGYKVHLDKLRRFGVPVYTRHTVARVEGEDSVEKVIIAEVDDNFQPVPGTEKMFYADTLLIAVGLDPVDELAKQAQEFGLPVYSAGDSEEISEASAAMFSGKMAGRRMLQDMGHDVDIPSQWNNFMQLLRSCPPPVEGYGISCSGLDVYPVIRCNQQIPCNPCTSVCPVDSIHTDDGTVTGLPIFGDECVGCGKCICICPGLAITLVDKRHDDSGMIARVVLPWEMPPGMIGEGEVVTTTGFEGEEVGEAKVVSIKTAKWQDRRQLVTLEVSRDQADLVAGIKLYSPREEEAERATVGEEEVIVCRCERVSMADIRREIRGGLRDFNSLKAVLRVGMGPCGGKTCIPLINRIFREEGVDPGDVEKHVERPFTQEVPMRTLLGKEGE